MKKRNREEMRKRDEREKELGPEEMTEKLRHFFFLFTVQILQR